MGQANANTKDFVSHSKCITRHIETQELTNSVQGSCLLVMIPFMKSYSSLKIIWMDTIMTLIIKS